MHYACMMQLQVINVSQGGFFSATPVFRERPWHRTHLFTNITNKQTKLEFFNFQNQVSFCIGSRVCDDWSIAIDFIIVPGSGAGCSPGGWIAVKFFCCRSDS